MKDFEFSLETIEKLIDIAKEKDISKLNVSYKDFQVFIDVKQHSFINFPSGAPVGNCGAGSIQAANEGMATQKKEETIKGKVVTSPIVGTFYSKPSPEKPDFVKVGDRVKKGDVLFIIESMKLMNEIKSEFDGVVSKILVESGDGVEYNQTIMIIE